MKRVLITGGSGFIGSHVADELLSRGYTPVIFDHHKKVDGHYPEGSDFFLGDVRDSTALTEAIAHSDGAIHLAAVLGTQETIYNPRPAVESNMLGGLNFLEAITQYNIPGVYIAVGNHWMNNPYSISKNMIERFCHMYNKDRGTRVNIVRAVNAYGPRQVAYKPFASSKVRKITPSLVCRALSGMPMELYGGGVQVSDMVYVLDVAKALVNALEVADSNQVLTEAVEIGPARNTTIREVAELVAHLVKELTGQQVTTEDLPMRPGETIGDKVSANIATLPWIGMSADELVPLEVGMRETVEWFIANEGKTWTKPS